MIDDGLAEGESRWESWVEDANSWPMAGVRASDLGRLPSETRGWGKDRWAIGMVDGMVYEGEVEACGRFGRPAKTAEKREDPVAADRVGAAQHITPSE